ncbi:MAG: SUMF1/EgtB/PvdO family nonheme iron enzyme, partial [Acidobacterium ailaaui]|nr:SUMF1/EgtB/PvdO family nonheme iron enzyme [Pseudacidobacterium ailaaui]
MNKSITDNLLLILAMILLLLLFFYHFENHNLKDSHSHPLSHHDMEWIPEGTFMMGATDNEGRLDEYPAHLVKVKGFWMDIHEVTNAEFRKFVEAT